jgi:hypothetical protein
VRRFAPSTLADGQHLILGELFFAAVAEGHEGATVFEHEESVERFQLHTGQSRHDLALCGDKGRTVDGSDDRANRRRTLSRGDGGVSTETCQ